MLEGEVVLKPEELPAVLEDLCRQGWRYINITGIDWEERMELIYHFNLENTLKHLRVSYPRGEVIPSISPVFQPAFLAENEIKEMFGAAFSDLVLDFENTMLLAEDSPRSPLALTTKSIGE